MAGCQRAKLIPPAVTGCCTPAASPISARRELQLLSAGRHGAIGVYLHVGGVPDAVRPGGHGGIPPIGLRGGPPVVGPMLLRIISPISFMCSIIWPGIVVDGCCWAGARVVGAGGVAGCRAGRECPSWPNGRGNESVLHVMAHYRHPPGESGASCRARHRQTTRGQRAQARNGNEAL